MSIDRGPGSGYIVRSLGRACARPIPDLGSRTGERPCGRQLVAVRVTHTDPEIEATVCPGCDQVTP